MIFTKNFLEKERQITIFDIFIILFGFTLFRGFLENFSNPEPAGFFIGFYSIFFEYFLFFISTFLLLLISSFYFTKIPINKLAKIAILFFRLFAFRP
jgi:hypothetical protein